MRTADPEFLEWRARPTRDSLRRLLLAVQDRVYSLSFHVLRHSQDAEDATQATLLEMAKGIGRISDPTAFHSWLYRVCLNNALSLRREFRRRRQREERKAAMVSAAVSTDDVRDAVHDALAQLEDEERALIVQHYFEKATLDDLGARNGISGPAIWKRIENAKEKMKRTLVGVGVAIGLTQMDSVLEAAEFVPAPPGLTPDRALNRMRPTSSSRGLRIAASVSVVGLLALVTGLAFVNRSDKGSSHPEKRDTTAPVPGTTPSVALPPQGEIITPAPPTARQEERFRVVDPEGRPLSGALVFPGRWFRLRGDDAFDSFRPNSIKDGVTTDADGFFKLETGAPFITAWHEDFTPTTVAASEKTIRMKARGVLAGRLVDAQGQPRAGVEISLDKRGPKQTTDANGRFKFEKVIAGYRGLILLQVRLGVVARVDPGQTVNVEVGPGLDITLDLSGHPHGAGKKLNNAGLIGISPLSSLVAVVGTTPAAELKNVLPGRYRYGEFGGPQGWVDISDKGAVVHFGSSTLRVEVEEATTLYLLPCEAHEIWEVAIMKMGMRKAGPSQPFTAEYLTEGDYELRDPEGRTLQRIKVGPGENRVTLKRR